MTPDQRERMSIGHGGVTWSEERKTREWELYSNRLNGYKAAQENNP